MRIHSAGIKLEAIAALCFRLAKNTQDKISMSTTAIGYVTIAVTMAMVNMLSLAPGASNIMGENMARNNAGNNDKNQTILIMMRYIRRLFRRFAMVHN